MKAYRTQPENTVKARFATAGFGHDGVARASAPRHYLRSSFFRLSRQAIIWHKAKAQALGRQMKLRYCRG